MQRQIETKRLLLRSLTQGDARHIKEKASDERIVRMTLRMPYPYLDHMAEEFVEESKKAWEKGEEYVYAIVPTHRGENFAEDSRVKENTADKKNGSEKNEKENGEENEMIGCIGLTVSAVHKRAEVGYWLAVSEWGKGYATEALRSIIDTSFNDLSLNKIDAAIFSDNPASARVLEKVGMQKEGYLRQHHFRWGSYRDSVLFGLLREEWENGR
eukprot:CAMPEP_0113866688 /NCGR_PEP_ID=MMETSP0780_2-20120614/7_1 /TAXON_ID=652834 /ORGANISM="Palpitomonas bilix" /LENGTH=212 /DNA_ID=CAMNT_0000851557 /DNA_START=164 /DNA_END=802 /DNA_ORIENTATION=+ /assembly_acc=CAM_ASM_000599